MNKLATRLIVYPIIMAIVVFIVWDSTKLKQISPLGNVLSAYFYCTNANCNKDVQNSIIQHTQEVKDPQLKRLYADFLWNLKPNQIIFNTPEELAWLQMNPDGQEKPNYLVYWQTIRSTMQALYNKTLPKVNIQTPVVHLRCSDSPFNRHNYYHLSRASTVEWMAKQVRDRGFNQVTLLNCNKHRTLSKNNCQVFADFYAKIFENNGITVTKQCGTVVNDFAMMYHAPILLSLNASSYAFMAGVAKDPQNYISANMGVEYNGKHYAQTGADWILSSDPPLLHSEVDDYYNYSHILQLLESKCG